MALLAVFALATAFTTAAFAELPDVHVLSGETYPVTGEGTVANGVAVVGTFETELGEKLTSTKVTAKLELKELSSLGPLTVTYIGVKLGSFECHTPGQADGVIIATGEYHVVYTNLVTLTTGFLILFLEQIFECNFGKLKIKAKAPVLLKLNVAAGTDVTEYKLESACKKGKQEPSEYYTEEGVLTKANFLINVGLGFEKACYFGEPLRLTSTKMSAFLF